MIISIEGKLASATPLHAIVELNGFGYEVHVPVTTAESDALSRDLRARGFNFVGSTICYSFMQAVGLVNDHDPKCFRYRQVK